MPLTKKLAAELIGTFWLVYGGCSAAGLCGSHIGWLGVGLAFGLTVLTMAYTFGTISGCHLNPAVSLGLVVGGRMPAKDFLPYVAAQIIGAIAGAALLFVVAGGWGRGGPSPISTAGIIPSPQQVLTAVSNGYGEHSPELFTLTSVLLVETVATMMFVIVILGSTHKNAPAGFAPIAIGLMLTGIHFVSIPVSNCSVNPARSLATALFAQPWALAQVWAFFVAPLVGGLLGGLIFPGFCKDDVISVR